MKLTKTQQAVLDELRAGSRLFYTADLNPHWWLSNTFKTVRHATVDALKREGMLELVKSDWNGSLWKAKP